MVVRKADESSPRRRRPPAMSPEARESQLISASIDLAEQQIASGKVSAQVLSHFLKLGSSRERLEQERLEMENEYLAVKIETLASQQRVEELYSKALNAMRSYSGQEVLDDYYDEE